jgi:CysZ protein
LPAIVSLVVLVTLAALAWFIVQTWLGGWIEQQGWWQGLAWLGGLLAFLIALFLAWFLFFPVMNLFAPIFLDPICEEVYRRHTGRELHGRHSASSMMKRQWFALVQSAKIFATTAMVELPLAIFALVTTIGSIVAFPVNGWLGGADLLDNPLALKHLAFRERLAFAWRYRWATAGLGGMAGLAMFIPVLNLLVVAGGTAGATLLMIQAERKSPSEPDTISPVGKLA